MHAVHIFPPDFPKIHYNIILAQTPTSSSWSLSYRFPDHQRMRYSVSYINNVYVLCDMKFCALVIIYIILPRLLKYEKEKFVLVLK